MSCCSRVTSQALPFSFEELKRWYNGYYTSDGNQLYNPWSIPNARFCALTGPNQVINFLVLFVHGSSILLLGYDKLIQDRITHALDKNGRFRKQMNGFLTKDAIEVAIKEGILYLSLITPLTVIFCMIAE